MNPQSLLDFSKPFNAQLFDQTVKSFFEGDTKYQNVLVKFQNHPQAWSRVHEILEKCQQVQCKIISLNILEECIKTRWKVHSKKEREKIKAYIMKLIIKLSSNDKTFKQLSVFIRKLNMVLIQIVKQDWPQNWPDFILELVNSSKISQTICANNMHILLLLSEELFDYSSGNMTQEKMKLLKKNLNQEFILISQLYEYILDNSQDPTLLTMTLRTLLRFLQWIPLSYIFETKLINTLAFQFFPIALFQNDALACLIEIGSIKLNSSPAEYTSNLIQMFSVIIETSEKLLTPKANVSNLYADGNRNAQTFIRQMAIFIAGFLQTHVELLESKNGQHQVLLKSLSILLRISEVEDSIVFKICVEYWNVLVFDIYNSEGKMTKSERLALYQDILSQLRKIIISKMAKPEEVLIIENKNGEIMREKMKDTDAVILHTNMKQCLIFLTHLNPNDTHDTMIEKLDKQMDGSEWSWQSLNSLCWAVGAITGATADIQEATFLVRVIKDLLSLCENKTGKDNKAVIASNIMYVVGQYPQFLQNHWKFLRTVVNKLFEFMHERYPGVQDMSCDTFLKVTKTCCKKFVEVQLNEPKPLVEEIIENLPETIKDLEPSQIQTFYKAVGRILQAQTDPPTRRNLVFKLMTLPNQSWSQMIVQANKKRDFLREESTVKQIVLVLQTNNQVAGSVGNGYIVQLARIYIEILQVYQMYSEYISNRIRHDGEHVTKLPLLGYMQAVKKETLQLIQCFLNNTQDSDKEIVYTKFLPALMQPVLKDYEQSVPAARDVEVLTLFSIVITKLGLNMEQQMPMIFESLFQSTLDMITKNFQDYPEHRVAFYELLRVINRDCFGALLKLSPKRFQTFMDSVVWAFKHLQCDVAEIGLNIVLELMKNMVEKGPEVANKFYKTFFISLLQDIISVLTDGFHKSMFQLHATILANFLRIVVTESVTVPLSKEGKFPNNQIYVYHRIFSFLGRTFHNLSKQQIKKFVDGLFKLPNDLTTFEVHLSDFLVHIKEFKKINNNGYLEEHQKK